MSDSVKKESGLFPVSAKEVENKIAVIRGMEVIADADVAALYGVDTKYVNRAVRNNPDKFPPQYMFELNTNELHDLRSKILTTNVVLMNRKFRPTTPLPRDGRCSLRSGRRQCPRCSCEPVSARPDIRPAGRY